MQQKPSSELLLVFVTLAKTLSLSKTARILGISRPTIRRRLEQLENCSDEPLFSNSGQNYSLTKAGYERLTLAINILRELEEWAANLHYSKNQNSGLVQNSPGSFFWAQQHPLSSVYTHGTPLLVSFLSAWIEDKSRISQSTMAGFLPYLIVYRETNVGLICNSIGDQSAFAKWYGKEQALATVGIPSRKDFVYDSYNKFSDAAYSGVIQSGGFRIDHISGAFPRPGYLEPQELSLQRLLASITLADESKGLAVLISLTNNVHIDAIPKGQLSKLASGLEMDDLDVPIKRSNT